MSATPPLILASASPRRRRLLAHLGVEFETIPAEAEEVMPAQYQDPVEVARDLALIKAEDVAGRFPDATVLGADTIVVLDGEVLGKPQDASDARLTLQTLRDREHQVYTGVVVINGSQRLMEHVETTVWMRDYADDEIAAYIDSGDPFDKAGSYAIQAETFSPVARIEGCFCNVVGLPLAVARDLLVRSGIEIAGDYQSGLPSHCRTCPLLAGDRASRARG